MSARIRCDKCNAESYYDGETKIYCPACFTALEQQLADAKSAVAYGNSEIEKLLKLVLEKDRELDMIKEIVRDPMVYSETMGYEAISRLGRVQELLLQRDEVERLEGEDDSK